MARKNSIENFRKVKPKKKKTMKVPSLTFVNDVPGFFERFGIKMDGSVTRMIQSIGERINEATDPLSYANTLIVQLGGQPIVSYNFTEVDMTAKHIILNAFRNPLGFDPMDAQQQAVTYVAGKRASDPWMFVTGDTKVSTSTDGVQDKKARAMQIYLECKDMPVKHVTERIMTELGITYANAYYYVRGFNKQFA